MDQASAAAVASALCLAAGAVLADPGYYVVTAYDNEGLVIVDARYWTVEPKGRGPTRWPEFGLGYGVGSRWTTELFASWIGTEQASTRLSTLNWQNDVLLTQGELPLDVALHTQFISDRNKTHKRGFEWGPVLQTDIWRTQINANVFFERGLTTSRQTMLKYQWQLRYHWLQGLHVGLQGFGELGPWDDWLPSSQQSRRLGPAVFGSWRVAQGQTLKLQAAYLTGRTYGREGHMFTTRLSGEF